MQFWGYETINQVLVINLVWPEEYTIPHVTYLWGCRRWWRWRTAAWRRCCGSCWRGSRTGHSRLPALEHNNPVTNGYWMQRFCEEFSIKQASHTMLEKKSSTIFPGLNLFYQVIFMVIFPKYQFNTQIYCSLWLAIDTMSRFEVISTESEKCMNPLISIPRIKNPITFTFKNKNTKIKNGNYTSKYFEEFFMIFVEFSKFHELSCFTDLLEPALRFVQIWTAWVKSTIWGIICEGRLQCLPAAHHE